MTQQNSLSHGVRTTGTTTSKPPYPISWRGAWFRPGVPGGMPSIEAKTAAWGVLIKAADREAAKKAEEQVA